MSNKILWSSICRNDVILVEAGEDNYDGAVVELGKKLLSKKATPGWEFQRNKKKKLRGIKLHVFDHDVTIVGGQREDHDTSVPKDEKKSLVWSFAAISESSLEKEQVKSFLEKLVFLTEPMRHDDNEGGGWRYGDLLCGQSSFAPILLQRMEQVEYQGRLAMVNQRIQSTKEIMSKNIDLILEREEHLQNIQERSESLNILSKQFKKRSKQMKRYKMWQNAKHGAVMGSAITAGVAVVTVPPLIALL